MRNMKKILSFLLVLSMVLSYVPMYALAAEGDPCTVTEGCQGTYNAEGLCTVCNLAQLVVTEGTEECQHSGGTATCTALANCDECSEPYGELAAHTGGEATCRAQAVCTVCTAAYGELAAHSYENGVCVGCGDICAHAEYAEGKCIVCGNAESDEPEECQHSGGVATCKEQAVCEKCETAYGELEVHNYGTDADGKCDLCGANCAHAEYLDGKCKVCDMDEPVQEPVVLTITAWNWVDDYEIIDPEYMDAVIPGVGTENPIDWETLVELLPAYITAVIDGGEVEIPVTWECETFPEETATGGRYALIAILPEGYALGEDVMGLELEVDLGVAEQLYDLEGDGSAANPYKIYNSTDLHEFVWRVNNNGGTRQTTACAKLMNSIEYDYDNDSDNVPDKWYALGSQTYPYTGTFDGNGCTISGLSLSDTEGQNSFIRYLGTDGVIKNLTISGHFSGSSNIGGIAGQNYGTISGCTFTGSVTCTRYNVGSIAGKNFGTITGCRNNGTVTGGENAGGIVGLNDTDGSVERSTNNGSVSGSQHVGGIAGTNNNSVKNCHNAGGVTATNKKAGGIVGVNNGIVVGCLNTASVTSAAGGSGGLIGENKSGALVHYSCFKTENSSAPTVGTNSGGTQTNTAKYTASDFQTNQETIVKRLNCNQDSGVWTVGTPYPVLGGNVTVTTEYPVWVAGVRITSSNMGNVLGDGTVSYNPQTLTLTLHNANIQYNPANAEAAIRNTYASNETLTITGSGTINAGNGSGIYSNKAKIKLSGGNLVIEGSTNGIVAEKGSLTIDGARVKAVGVQNGTFADDGISVTMGGGLLSVTGKKAVVYGSYSMGSETYDQLTVATDAILTVESGKTVTVNNRIDSSGEIHVNGTLKIPAGSGFTTISGGTLYIGEKGYRWDDNKYVCITHDWSYTASGNTLNALCQDNNCSTGGSVTINAPALTAYGGTENANARLSADSIGSIENLSEWIKYQKKNADSWDAETTVAPTAVGTYKASLTVNDQTISVEYTIAKAQPAITMGPTIDPITYGQTLADADITDGEASVEGVFAFKDQTIAPAVSDSNTTEYTLVFTPANTDNYNPMETKVKVTVNPKEVGIIWGTANFTYDGNAKLPNASVTEGSAINGDQLGLTVTLVETTEGAGINAGTYTAKVTGITGDKAANYKLPENVTTSFEIKNASQTKPENLTGKKETIRNKADGTIAGLTTAMEISKEENGTYTAVTDVNMTFAAGTYYVRYAAKANYDASPATAITIDAGELLRISVPGDQVAYSLTADKTEAAWHDDVTITFTLKDGYSVTADFAVKVNGQAVKLDQDGKYTIQAMEAAVVVTVEGIADTTAPTVTVTLEDNWNSLWNGITFGKFFKETKTFTISAADQETGLKAVSYYLASEELEDVTTAAVTWTAYDLTGSGVSVDPDKVFVIYAKAEDNAGNITYVNSNGIVLDKTDPVITGVTNGAVYYTTQKITANDTYLDTKRLNGTEFDGTIPGDPAQETKHTIVATDKAGNNTTFEITMKPISSLAADLPTEETVKLVDKGAIEAIKQNVSIVSTTHATDAEKAKLKDIIDRCDLLLNRIERAENVIALINAMPDVSKVEPDDKTAIDAYDAAAAAYNDANLPASSKRMVGEENKAKLDAMLKALTAYDVIKGHKSSYTRGSGKTFSLTASGYFGKFTGLKIDGKFLDSKYYTAKSGSTIVTLKNSYLDSLADGKHTVEFLYTDGSTGGDHYFRISTNNGSPFTGDNNHIMMFSGIMMTSLLCVVMMVVFAPKKKGKYQR